jgi:hypothetical protein
VEFSRKRVIKLAVMLVFFCCMLYANFFAVRLMLHYGVDTYFYDKLLVAYTIGGSEGLRTELNNIPVTDKLPRESILAKDFAARLKGLKDPEAYLKEEVRKSKKMVSFIRNLRSAAIYLMFILFGWQLIMNFINRPKSGRPA